MNSLTCLDKQSEFYNLVFQRLNVYFFTYDIPTKTVTCPEETRDAFGCKETYENMPESFADDFVAEEYRESFFQLYADCDAGEDMGECLFEDKAKQHLVCVRLQIIRRDAKGAPVTAVGIIESQPAFKALLRKQSMYINAILANSVGYMEINLSKNQIMGEVIDSRDKEGIILIDRQSETKVGRGYDEFERWWAENMLLSNKAEFLNKSNSRYLISCYEQGHRVVDVFCSSKLESGEATENKQTYYLSKDASTGDIVAMCVVYDMTQKNRMERELYFQNMILQKMSDEFSAISYANLDKDLIVDYRTDSTWESWEDEEKNNSSYREMVENFAESFVMEEDKEDFRKKWAPDTIKEMLAEKETYRFDYRIKNKDEIHYYEVKMVADDNAGDDFCVIIGFKNTDEKMKHQHLLEETLQYAQHASKAKTNFLSNMSHDMRTPMNAIIGFTALAAAHLDDKERVKSYLEKISISGNHLLSLINDILDMSRIESGKVVLNETAEDLGEILHDLRAMVQSQINAKQLDFFIDTFDVRDELIYCDKIRLKQVLLNIFSNAVKYTSPGGTVSVRIIQKESRQRKYGNYEFRIKDTGRGMSKEFLERIFDPFVREERQDRDATPGAGLGLSIVKNIVDIMNGKIEVFSEVGKGSEFVVSLTFKLLEEKQVEYDFSRIGGFRALVVDDDFHTCDAVTRMLREIGMRPEFTMHGKEAILKAKQAFELKDEFFVYIIDWIMPDMNGLEVVRRIRKVIGDGAPIIILTAYDWDGITEEAMEAGVTAICEKPLFMSRLKKVIATACGWEAMEEPEPVVEMDFTGKKALLVEDIEINREIATEILQEKGFEISIAENGRKAVEMIANAQPGDYDIILMDIRMPEMNGYEATRAIRQLDSVYKDIPIVAMTANVFEDDRQMSFQSGMNEHISKPLNEEEMFTTLWNLLG